MTNSNVYVVLVICVLVVSFPKVDGVGVKIDKVGKRRRVTGLLGHTLFVIFNIVVIIIFVIVNITVIIHMVVVNIIFNIIVNVIVNIKVGKRRRVTGPLGRSLSL